MWFSVVWTLVYSGMRHHSGQSNNSHHWSTMRQVALIVRTREVGKILRHKHPATFYTSLFGYHVLLQNLMYLSKTPQIYQGHHIKWYYLKRPPTEWRTRLILNLSCAKKFIEETFSWRYPSNDSSLRPNQVVRRFQSRLFHQVVPSFAKAFLNLKRAQRLINITSFFTSSFIFIHDQLRSL